MLVSSKDLESRLDSFLNIMSGNGIQFRVIKATSNEFRGPKRKHLDYLVQMTHEPNVSMDSLTKHLMKRVQSIFTSWVVLFKTLITIHWLIANGNGRFMQNLATGKLFTKRITDFHRYSYENELENRMQKYMRRYADYIELKVSTYRNRGTEFCRIEQSTWTWMKSATKKDNKHQMSNSKNLLLIIENLLFKLLDIEPKLGDLDNGIIVSAFNLIYKDFIKLYLIYQVAMTRFFRLSLETNNSKQAWDMYWVYRRSYENADKILRFLEVVDALGLDKSDLPSDSQLPNPSILDKHYDGLLRSEVRSTLTRSESRDGSKEVPRIEYCTLTKRSRRSSLRTTPVRTQTAMDILSPTAVIQYSSRADELRHLDEMLGMGSKNKTGSNGKTMNCDRLVEEEEEDLEVGGGEGAALLGSGLVAAQKDTTELIERTSPSNRPNPPDQAAGRNGQASREGTTNWSTDLAVMSIDSPGNDRFELIESNNKTEEEVLIEL